MLSDSHGEGESSRPSPAPTGQCGLHQAAGEERGGGEVPREGPRPQRLPRWGWRQRIRLLLAPPPSPQSCTPAPAPPVSALDSLRWPCSAPRLLQSAGKCRTSPRSFFRFALRPPKCRSAQTLRPGARAAPHPLAPPSPRTGARRREGEGSPRQLVSCVHACRSGGSRRPTSVCAAMCPLYR